MILGVSLSILPCTLNAIRSITQLSSISTDTLGSSWWNSDWMSPNQLPCQWQWSFTRRSQMKRPVIWLYNNHWLDDFVRDAYHLTQYHVAHLSSYPVQSWPKQWAYGSSQGSVSVSQWYERLATAFQRTNRRRWHTYMLGRFGLCWMPGWL